MIQSMQERERVLLIYDHVQNPVPESGKAWLVLIPGPEQWLILTSMCDRHLDHAEHVDGSLQFMQPQLEEVQVKSEQGDVNQKRRSCLARTIEDISRLMAISISHDIPLVIRARSKRQRMFQLNEGDKSIEQMTSSRIAPICSRRPLFEALVCLNFEVRHLVPPHELITRFGVYRLLAITCVLGMTRQFNVLQPVFIGGRLSNRA
mmetsp:Transcript_24213/g.45928  ORF Transcript_24213/g.45928 Transcript_24213/m.45928 type:complete len:205 (-) Transcript_24213:200-814(-)